jgi:hypothetical protein
LIEYENENFELVDTMEEKENLILLSSNIRYFDNHEIDSNVKLKFNTT